MKGLKPPANCFRSSFNSDSEIPLRYHGLFGLPLGPVKPPDLGLVQARDSNEGPAWESKLLWFKNSNWNVGIVQVLFENLATVHQLCHELEIMMCYRYLRWKFQFHLKAQRSANSLNSCLGKSPKHNECVCGFFWHVASKGQGAVTWCQRIKQASTAHGS